MPHTGVGARNRGPLNSVCTRDPPLVPLRHTHKGGGQMSSRIGDGAAPSAFRPRAAGGAAGAEPGASLLNQRDRAGSAIPSPPPLPPSVDAIEREPDASGEAYPRVMRSVVGHQAMQPTSNPILTWDVRFPLGTPSHPDWILHQILMVLSVPEGRQAPTETAFRQPASPFPHT